MTNKPENWDAMTPAEKRTYRLEKFRSSGKDISFASPQAEKNYHTRVQRLIDVFNVEKPDRVPLNIRAGNLPLVMEGLDTRTMFYEPEKAWRACISFNEKYSDELELFAAPSGASGQVLEILEYKQFAWPGHGLNINAGGWQFIEGEYMTADEYDDLIHDPSGFWLHKYMPRIYSIFEGFSLFQPFTNMTENVHVTRTNPLSQPEVRRTLQKLLDAGEVLEKNGAILSPYSGLARAHGFLPSAHGIPCSAPFDTLGDTLRGTTNIMKDMFRRPEKLLAALEVVTEITISNIINHPGFYDAYMIRYALHKGADGWMSPAQFDKFYWPFLKRCMDAFIQEGLIQQLFAEGSYNTRLEHVNQFPKGTVTWLFDQTDMAFAKKILGKECCLQGNIPASLIVTSSPDDVKKYCRNLIETAGENGGYILCPGAQPEKPRLENLRAIVEAVNEYGFYS